MDAQLASPQTSPPELNTKTWVAEARTSATSSPWRAWTSANEVKARECEAGGAMGEIVELAPDDPPLAPMVEGDARGAQVSSTKPSVFPQAKKHPSSVAANDVSAVCSRG
eukprot:scaffold113829_cov30-Tisochrysis_lutea.AAC.3